MKSILAILLSTVLVSVSPFKYQTEATNINKGNNEIKTEETKKTFIEKAQLVKSNTPTKKTHYVTVTAYSSTPDQTDDTPFITANGTRVRDGIIATNFLPFGTEVRFPDYSGDKVYTVTDRMNKRFSDRADIWFKTREQALNFGIRKLKMEVI